MKYKPLGRTGLFVSEICLGTMTFGGRGELWPIIGQVDQAAANNLKAGSKELKALQGVLKFYGKEGEKNGVNVSFGTLNGNAEAQTTQHMALGFIPTKSIDVKFDLGQMKKDFGGRNDVSESSENAGIVAHEGQHGVNARENGWSHGFDATKADEASAFRTQSDVNQGLGTRSAYGLWNPSWKSNEAESNRDQSIDKNADDAARNDCENGGC